MAIKLADPQTDWYPLIEGKKDKPVALNWKSVTADHVREALRLVLASRATNRVSGLILIEGDRTVSAKEVLRVAYRIANKLQSDADIKFSSGDGTLNILRNLGFNVTRVSPK